MLYLKVLWNHNYVDQPSVIYSEIDEQGWEVRKVEIFRDGHSTFASLDTQTGKTRLSDKKIETQDIQTSDRLSFSEITPQEFDESWGRAQNDDY